MPTQLHFPVIEMLVSDREVKKWYTSPLEKANARLHIAYMRELLAGIIEEQNMATEKCPKCGYPTKVYADQGRRGHYADCPLYERPPTRWDVV